MSTVQALLTSLRKNGVSIWLDNGQLKYRAPAGGLSQAELAELRANKEGVISFLTYAHRAAASRPKLAAREPSDRVAMSYAQERLWFLDQLGLVGSAYNMPFALRLDGELDAAALEQSLAEVVRRHEALRTHIELVDGQGVQVIDAAASFRLELLDLSHLGVNTQEAEIRRLAKEEASYRFELTRGPVFRARLIRLGARDYVVLATMHHIVSDGWSIGVLTREVAAIYEAFSQGKSSPLPELPVQYADYALWQRAWLQGDALERQLAYWKERLKGAPAALELPTDRPRPSVASFAGGMVPFTLSRELSDGLTALSRRSGATLYMVLLAAYQLLLSRYSGQTDIVVGSPIAGRIDRQLEGLIGFFVNTLAMRTDLSDDPSFMELLARVKEMALGAFAHQDLPFERLVEELQPVRDLSRQPVFQVSFSLQNVPQEAIVLSALTFRPLAGEQRTSVFDLSLFVWETDGRLQGRLEYALDLFDRGTVERFAHHLEVLLEGIVAAPERRLSSLPVLSAADRRVLLEDWAGQATSYPENCLHELFMAQAARTPDAVAVGFEGEQLSYRELDARSNQLAHHLRCLGVGPGVVVGLCVERSLELVVALLGILKAGGAYLPLDPGYPLQRLSYMLHDAGAPVIVTQRHLAGVLPAHAARVVELDTEAAAIAAWPQQAPVDTSRPANLAYVIYTSGSTGRPKGVAVTHSNIVRLVKNANYVSVGVDDVFLHLAPLAFDASTFEIWMPLLNGARLIVYPAGFVEVATLKRVIAESRVTVLWLTAGLFHTVIEHDIELVRPLRYLLAGGDVLSPSHVQRVLDEMPDCQLVNGYGPTEGTTFSACFAVAPRPGLAVNVPIGRPISNTQLYVLDDQGELVPAGVAGELYIGGAGLARGYFGRADLTAERFVPSPFGCGERLYRTGDLARWLKDGVLEYLGRRDQQVKIRGFRIELGEIEAALTEHAGVSQAVVAAQADSRGGKRLVAYVVGHAEVATEDLRAHLARRLPDYMMPSAYVQLATLPLTANGKLDREALPVPETAAFPHDRYEAPRGETEERLAQIWCELLKVARVGRHDDFFALGGHSLLAITLIERMRRAGLVADIRAVFSASDLAGLAAAASSEVPSVEVPANLVPEGCTAITPAMLPLVKLSQSEIDLIASAVDGGMANIQDIYPLAPLQEGVLFHHMMDAEHDAYLLSSVLAFDTRSRLDGFVAALDAVISRHDILRTSVMWEQLPQPVQVVWRRVRLAVEDVVLDEPGGDAALQLRSRFGRSQRLDVRHAPLLRGCVAHDGQHGRWLLLLTYHHLVMDHTTLEVLTYEVHAHLMGRQAELPAPVPFRNFIGQALHGVSTAEHETFFRELLADVTEPSAPFGLVNVQGDGTDIEDARHALPAALSARLRGHARELGVSAASLFHLAWGLVVSRTSGGRDAVFGTVLFGRLHGMSGADRTAGMFINTLPVRIAIGEKSAAASVRDVHALLGRLLRHEHASLALAQRCCGIKGSGPLFTSLLNYRYSGGVANDPAWDGIELLWGEERTNYPVMLSVDDAGDGFGLTAQTMRSIGAAPLCRMMETALTELADALAQHPERPMRRLEVLSAADRRLLLEDWAGKAKAYPERCLHELFAAQAARTPDAVAVAFEGEQLSYCELDAHANQLAHHLRGLGVGPEVVVGLCVERSLELVVALLGILKAGGAYLPLDPGYPADRLSYMLHDAGAPVIVTQRHLAGVLPAHAGRVVELDADAAAIAAWPQQAPVDTSRPANLAYVIYTSGSTGRPKGVMVAHAGLINFLTDMAVRPGIDASDVVAAVTPISFDIAGLEIYLPLLAGARVVVLPRELSADGERLRERLAVIGATMLQATPATWRLLTDAGWRPSASLKVLCGGEALPPDLASRLADGSSASWNLYGPTETTVWSSLSRITTERRIGIGHAIANTQLHVLDGHGELVPVGVAGELYIGGAGLARGYFGRAALTAERFVPSPFGDGERLYRTGDLVRWRADGELDYLGRLDHQVKIRGFRIELGEIEAALLAHAGVSQAVVTAQENGSGGTRLVAYVVGEAAVRAEDLRAQLSRRLPDYMVPSAYVQLAALPQTPYGKLDRKALPAPGSAAFGHRAFIAPLGEVEERLAQIWCELLKLDRIGRHDDFFALGGHSLLAMRALSRLRDEFVIDLPLRAMFDAPRLSDLAGRIESALRSGAGVALPPLQVQPRPERLVLSYAQERLWFLDQLGLVGAAYNLPFAVRLEGTLDTIALERSFAEVVRRHEAMRTHFETEQGQAVQIIDAPSVFRLGRDDLSELEDDEVRRLRIDRLLRDAAVQPFDLSRGPLFRARLIRLGPQDHVVLVTMHHIVSDGWSIGVLVRELAALYEAYRTNAAPPLADPQVQYADYALWQRAWLQGEALERQLAYWKTRLTGAPAALELPTNRARPAVASFAGGMVPFTLSRALSDGLKALSSRSGATLYMVLLAAHQVLLSRYSGQTDIVVGSPIAGRVDRQLEGLIGFFVNTLAMRTDLSGNPSFIELLGRVKEVALGAYAHQDLPFEKLVEELQPVRDLSRQPVFQVSFSLQNTPQDAIELPVLTLRLLGSEHRTSLFDLTLFMRETEAGLVGTFEYASDLFDRATIERLAEHFEILLGGIVSTPEARLSELPLLSEAERHQLIIDWNATKADYPADKCLHELFAEQAARTPDGLAVVFEGQQLSYQELDIRSNQLAHHLRRLGVGPEVVVGLCVERSLEMVVALLGILKAGGAYLPLDPGYPAERLSYMMQNAGAPVIVTQQRLAASLPAHAGRVVEIDAAWSAIAAEPQQAPVDSSRPGNLAYVIYTSGSTGRPKGVANTHGGIVNRLVWMQAAYRLGPGDRVLQKTPFSFDVSVWEFFWPLIEGVPLVVARPEGHQDPSYLAALIQREAVTIAHFVPSMLQVFLETEDVSRCVSLRAVMCSGEALGGELKTRFLRRSRSELHNLYGPTEAAVDVSAFACRLGADAVSVPIGRPISNMQLHVLDDHGALVPVGVAGELYIGGVGLARGYFGRADLTAERFVPSPFGDGERLYRTGDLVRCRTDGELEYLGRLDHQVKIRGFRIELGEIEAALAEHADVSQAVVTAPADGSGDRRLVAYVVGDEKTIDPVALSAHLKRRVPDYMVPAASAFVILDQLPLSPNGKLDRDALPQPQRRHSAGEAAPRTAAEEILAKLWSDLLGLHGVGVHDDFFELGGHSLLAMRLIAQVRHALGVDLPVRLLFEEKPTIGVMAAHIAVARAAKQGFEMQGSGRRDYSCIIPIQLSEQGTPIICVHPIGGGILCYRDLAKSLGPGYSVYGIKALGLHGEQDPLVSIDQMADHHVARMLEIQQTGPFNLVGWSAGGLIAFAIARKLNELGHQVGVLALIDTVPPSSTGEWRHNRRQVERTEWLTFMGVLEIPPQRGLTSRWHSFWRLSDAAKADYVLRLAKRHRSLSSEMTDAEFAHVVSVFQANLHALQQHVVSPYVGKLLLFQPDGDPVRTPDHFARAEEFWRSKSLNGFDVHYVPGNHGSMIQHPASDHIAARLRAELERAQPVSERLAVEPV
ncbi:non-ribosomal peptide synthetase [Bradyrhizobium sp. SZCCHNRI1002]|uniref:non-ribosomal peptide synthetase n=1 Tax=Bradyrhizobium sp. SZCCHNRI1002 TaxID=3057274 RepID=UPI0028E6F4C6|nr:non-ribosomal peptide synthetase [Bradyrhizobium sp. SZCCHNRI1002]